MYKYPNGVIYIVTTHKSNNFLEAALASAKSVAEKNKGLGIHLYTDALGMQIINSYKSSPFTSISEIKEPHRRSKVDYLSKTPFERTLYLDSDTLVVDDITEMFVLLDRFDIALAQAHQRNNEAAYQYWRQKLPPSFPQYNGGVILYKNTPLVNQLLEDWSVSFHHAQLKRDQFTLRELLWESSAKLATLPPEYNIRYKRDLKQWKRKEVKPKILHMAKFHKSKWNEKLKLKSKEILHKLSYKKLTS